MNEIRFYKVNDDYGYFSNFARYPILLQSFVWPTVEHYFQANKFDDYRIQDFIRELASPMDAAIEGRKKDKPIRNDWDAIKNEVMLRALKAKFLQHPVLRRSLLQTKNAILIEHTENDNYWADGGDGTGQNMLGKLLMQVREDLIAVDENTETILPPWIAFPDVSPLDMFWRMGWGETYLESWTSWFILQPVDKQANYKAKFPEPEEWNEFYEL